MTVNKKRVLSVINAMPQKFDIDDLIERLYLEKKLELAEQDIASKRVVSHKKMSREIQKWFK